MSSDEAFIEAIREQPGDDAVRLIYADWLMDRDEPARVARGRFIRAQVERPPGHEAEEQALARDHIAEWLRPLREVLGRDSEPWMDGADAEFARRHFVRGFVWGFTLTARAFLDRVERLRRWTPVAALQVVRLEDGYLEFLRSPLLNEVESLHLQDYYRQPLDAGGLEILAGSPHLGRLTDLSLRRNNIGDDGVPHLGHAPWAAGLRSLDLGDCGLGSDGFAHLAAVPLPALRELRLAGNDPGAIGVAALVLAPWMAQLENLDLSACRLNYLALEAFLAAPDLDRLRVLRLNDNYLDRIDRDIRARLPDLDYLDL